MEQSGADAQIGPRSIASLAAQARHFVCEAYLAGFEVPAANAEVVSRDTIVFFVQQRRPVTLEDWSRGPRGIFEEVARYV